MPEPASHLAKRAGSTVTCDVAALTHPDAGVIGALARLGLIARRLGVELRLSHVSDELAELLRLAGLDEVLGVEPRGQPEEREQRLGVQEEGDVGDPAL